MNKKSDKTLNNMGTIYMSGLNERISMHFETIIDMRFSSLLNRNINEEVNNVCKKSETDASACLSDKELVIDILSRIPANDDYKYLQVMISRIIAENLKRNGIYQEDLISCGMAQKKVTDLFDSSSNNEKILAFNNSDLMRIVHNFRVGYDLIFTGV